jgi:hypothetical protein
VALYNAPCLVAAGGHLHVAVAVTVVVHRAVGVLDVVWPQDGGERPSHHTRGQHGAQLSDVRKDMARVLLLLGLAGVRPVVALLPEGRVPLGWEVCDRQGQETILDVRLHLLVTEQLGLWERITRPTAASAAAVAIVTEWRWRRRRRRRPRHCCSARGSLLRVATCDRWRRRLLARYVR